MKLEIVLTICLVLFSLAETRDVYGSQAEQQRLSPAVVRDVVNDAFSLLVHTSDRGAVERSFTLLDAYWQPAFIPQLLDIVSVPRNDHTRRTALGLLAVKTGQEFGSTINDWYYWLWNQPEQLLPGYADFKAELYGQIDPRFETYFRGRQASARIRLDEVRWGGVLQDGIPPLRNPEMIRADQADYLGDDNIIFGLELNGDARAYPQRVLAWHEMFTDTIGGVDIAGVYCTLCGTVIPYRTRVNGVDYTLGTSGFLYRSNKLMYDRKTQSLWSTVRGEPVIGPLANKGIRLEHVSMVTTTWGEWKRRHPDTTVLSLNTGHNRDYGEGKAYQRYFSTDQLMFNTPFRDDRLRNKQEVLALTFPASPGEQLAITREYLQQHPLYTDTIGEQKILVLTDTGGASRVYNPKGVEFVSYDRDSTVVDSNGLSWIMSEASLQSAEHGQTLERLPSRTAFWFGWHAAFPDTRLVK